MTLANRSRVAMALRAAAPVAVIALTAATLLFFPPTQTSLYPQCPIYEYLHLQCPGCGATRAIAALLRGHFAEAIHFNALITLLSPFVAAYGILCYYRLVRRKSLSWPLPPASARYAAIAIAVLFTVIRNLPQHSF